MKTHQDIPADRTSQRWRNRYVLVCILALLFSVPNVLFSQGSASSESHPSSDPPASRTLWRTSLSLFGGLTFHDVALDVYHGTPGCGQWTGQTGASYGSIASFEYPVVHDQRVYVRGHLSLDNRPIRFTESFSSPARYLDGAEETVITRHRFDVDMTSFGIGVGLTWEPVEGVQIGASPALRIVSASDPEQYEEVVAPLGASFTQTGDFRRPIDRGTNLSFSSTLFELEGMASFVVPVTTNLYLQPGIGVDVGLTSIEDSYPWRTQTLFGSLGLGWAARSAPEPVIVDVRPPQPPVVDPTVLDAPDTTAAQSSDTATGESVVEIAEPKPHLEASIRAVGLDDRGNEYPEPVIEIREAPWSRSIPLIPHLFFKTNSAEISERYALLNSPAEADRFVIDSLIGISPIELHRHLLNVLGQRLRARPEVSVTIVGTTSSRESDSLRLARAASVRDYLRDVWKVDDRRMSLDGGEPTDASSEETADGRVENQRAEFVFDGEALLRPVVVERLAMVASPPAVRFYRNVVADTALARWDVSVQQGERVLMRLSSDGTTIGAEESRYWPLAELRVNRDLTPITYRFEVEDVTGQITADENAFVVREQRTEEEASTGEVEINEYLLVGFPFNSAELKQQHKAEIFEIAQNARPGDWIEVTGYTDRVGDADRNRELAQSRAQRVVTTLREIRQRLSLPELDVEAVRGSGETVGDVYNNDFPEGRIFSRMVRVTVNRVAENTGN